MRYKFWLFLRVVATIVASSILRIVATQQTKIASTVDAVASLDEYAVLAPVVVLVFPLLEVAAGNAVTPLRPVAILLDPDLVLQFFTSLLWQSRRILHESG